MAKHLSLDTRLVQPTPNSSHRSLCAPVIQSTTFVQSEIGGSPGGFAYSRVSNPTVEALEKKLGELEQALPAVCCASGLAAETVLFLALLKAGDHVVCGQAVYGGTTRLLQQLLSGLGVCATFVDATDPHQLGESIRDNTRLVFLETPANPTLDLTDIQRAAEIAHDHGALVAVDNTFLTPLGQQPLEWGADVSVYSTTKLIDGHSAALGGALVSRREDLVEHFKWIRKSIGCIQTPANAWQTLQGLKTLSVRIRTCFEAAQRVAEWLTRQLLCSRVHYPGLDDFQQRELADRQHLAGHGNVVSFELAGGYDRAIEFVKHLRLCRLVEHVGSVETLVTHSASMTHADVPAAERRAAGISDGLLRLSIGIEEVQDIIDDLDQALTRSTRIASLEIDKNHHGQTATSTASKEATACSTNR